MDRWNELAAHCNVGVLAYYGIAQGFQYRSAADLAKSVRGPRIARYLDARGFAVLAALDEMAAEIDATQAQVALAWVAGQPGVTTAIASATSLAQIDELLGAMTLELDAAQISRLNAVAG